jgi:hypothetical protein
MIDVGGGASTLVDALLNRGWVDLTVRRVRRRLRTAQDRLGAAADRVEWLAADLLSWAPKRRYMAWHDRALLHFFPTNTDQDRYRDVLHAATTSGSWRFRSNRARRPAELLWPAGGALQR